ncbi:MaoC family dehydratase [Streptomyces sp. NBC_01643]|uniref:MaoC family dehydratase n=1 Tax=Streptomyces sp. NBC_01643 TaxID=2975906 RepID=UPI002F916519|nr:MaoC family dehydratase [Streptomyces sp. NBC_01643]
MTLVVETIDDLKTLGDGAYLGTSEWFEVDQRRIDVFADATDDHQWIHVDPERAARGPFKGTVAHGYLTLALIVPMWSQILDVRNVTTKLNYGLDKVRFPAPVAVGSKIRTTAVLASVQDIPGGVQIAIDATIEREGSDKPVCAARLLFRYLA